MNNVVLVGFMGSGKSTVGRMLADRIEYEFIDTDKVIEERVGRSIAQIFEQEGEERFRELESLVVKSVCGSDRQVISSGGGAILRPDNLECLASSGKVIYLRLTEEQIVERTKKLKGRPLLAGRDRKARIHELFAQRSGLYEKVADVSVDVGDLTPDDAVDVVLGALDA